MFRALRPFILLTAVSLSVASVAQSKFGGVDTIKQDDLKAHLDFISHDLLEGRNTPSRGLEIAAHYIQANLRLWGVKPGGTKGYFQHFDVRTREGQAETYNVIGIVEGTDPVLKDEYVLIGAHYDHVGMRTTGDDKIFNGADDNGSGTVALLEMAQALASGPKPKRSVMFVWFSGEEKGLLGSEFHAANPTVPLDKIVTVLNLDMIGRSWTPDMGEALKNQVSAADGVFVIGSKLMSTRLGQISEDVNKSFLKMKFDYKYDDPSDTQRLFYRSDHYSYAKRGVPAIFYFDGIHPDYHRVTDEVAKIDWAKLEMVTKTVFATAWTVAMEKERPKVDKVLDR